MTSHSESRGSNPVVYTFLGSESGVFADMSHLSLAGLEDSPFKDRAHASKYLGNEIDEKEADITDRA